jgi:hypothetical protein
MNRAKLHITIKMIDAGVDALKVCHAAGGYTPRSICQVVFQAMIAESTWSPAVRKRPGRTPSSAPPSQYGHRRPTEPAHPLKSYEGRTAGPYVWQAFHARTGYHYLRQPEPEKWIRLTDADWEADNLAFALEHLWYSVQRSQVYSYLGHPHKPRTPKRR